MQNSTDFFKNFFLENPIPMWIYDIDTFKIVAVNNAAVTSYGYSKDEFLSKTILDIRPTEDIPDLLKHLKEKRPETEKGEIWRHKKKDGSIIYVDISSHSILFNNRQCRLIIAYDITEKKFYENKFYEAENKFNTLVEKSLFGIYIIQNGKFIYVNDEFANMFGYTKEEIINQKSLYDLLDQSSFQIKYGEIFERLSNNFEVKKYKFIGVKKDNSKINIEVSSSITEYNGKIALIGTVIDVTEINRTAEVLAYHYELEKLLSRISTRFVELSSYDIDKGIDAALQDIGQFMDVDRSYIFLFSDDKKTMSNTHEWCAKGIEPQIEKLQNLPTDDFRWTMEGLNRYSVIKISNVEDLPEEATNEKIILQAQDIKSLILVPMIYNGKLIGFIGFDSVLKYRDWEDESATALKMLGEIFSNAISKKQTELELFRLYNAIWQIDESVIITDINGIIEYVNPAFEKLTGYKKEEAIGKKPNILKSGKHSKEFYEQLWSKITNGEMFETEFINKKKNGDLYFQHSTITPMKDNSGNITSFICIGHDVTEKKKSEEMHSRLTAILEATSDFVSTADCNYNILYINKHGKKMAGLDGDSENKNLKISDFHPEWATKKILNEGIPKAIQTGIWMGETAIRTLNGREIPVSQVIISHKNETGDIEYFSTIIRDISDIKKTQDKLKKLLNEVTEKKSVLEKLSKDLIFTEEKERKKFSRELHDGLGQVLSNLKLNLDLLNRTLLNPSNEIEQYLTISRDLVNDAIQEVKQLSYDLRPSVLDDFGLNAALRLLANQFQKRSGISVNVCLDNEDVRYDPIIETAFYRIAQECLTNIAKHSKAKSAELQLIKRGNILALTICDDGIGFDLDKALKVDDDILHFGLKNIRERVEFLGGKLYIESSIGRGTEISAEIELKT